ncbi:MAG: Co2+/Mg2+ efflux protein ApaG [Azonexus sp.]|jgi:ApaG protein|nr:Co2+/Mg2+ efflux protein ApaG [Azonexus sp.]
MPDKRKYDIQIAPVARFLPEQSSPADHRYLFTYTITIHNAGELPVQLVSRHWIITDANQAVQEVRGLGVIGQQPLLQPGESFRYTSGSQLATPVGTMRGSYQMVAADGAQFDAEIPEFALAMPQMLH